MTENDFEIRPMKIDDIPIIFEKGKILAEFQNVSYLFTNTLEKMIRDYQSKFFEMFVAETKINDKTKIIGYLMYVHDYHFFRGLYLISLKFI